MTSDLLTSIPGRAVEGIYPLGKRIGSSRDRAVYETQFGDTGQLALIELRRDDTPDAERLLGRWRDAVKLSHPNLLRLYAAGRYTLDEIPVIYLVMERTDESLASVLAERALCEEEAREMLEPALSALCWLHRNGYAHGSLDCSHILAAGDTLKLSSAGVTKIKEGGVPAQDMWALGVVLVQALTRGLPKLGENPGPYILQGVSEPLSGIVRHCLDPDPNRRWTAEQTMAHLNPQTAPQPAPVAPVRDEGAGYPARAVPHVAASRTEHSQNSYRKWIYGAVAALILIVAAMGFTKKTDRPAVLAGTGAADLSAAAPSASAVPRVEPEIPPVAAAAPAAPGQAKGEPKNAGGWVVVVGSYGARAPAEKRAREMAKKWSSFKVEVFEAASEKARHLVVLGTDLPQDQADALRKRAIASGMPHDTYIKKLGAGPG